MAFIWKTIKKVEAEEVEIYPSASQMFVTWRVLNRMMVARARPQTPHRHVVKCRDGNVGGSGKSTDTSPDERITRNQPSAITFERASLRCNAGLVSLNSTRCAAASGVAPSPSAPKRAMLKSQVL
jgi:hypothetical protein